MSINDFVEMTIFLCLVCFSIHAKMQGVLDACVFFTEENNFWEKSPVESADTLGVKIKDIKDFSFSALRKIMTFS